MRGLFIGGALAGALLGFGLGLVVARTYWPIPIWGASAADLRRDFKDDYIRMIASSYSLDGDMARALQRLAPLKLSQPDAYLSGLALRDSSSLYRDALDKLAVDLKQPSVALSRATFTPRPVPSVPESHTSPATLPPLTGIPHITVIIEPTATSILIEASATAPLLSSQAPTIVQTETATPVPTSTPNPANPFFSLKTSDWLNCLATQGQGIIEVQVQEADGRPVPAVGVELSWDGGDEVFYTGLKPERGMGYADIQVSPGIYRLRLIDNAVSTVVENLRIDAEPDECPGDGSELRGWKLFFQRSE